MAGHLTYHVKVIKLKWEIIWTGVLPYLSRLPHLTGAPQLHINRPSGGEKTRTGASFIPGWLFDFVSRLHNDWVISYVVFFALKLRSNSSPMILLIYNHFYKQYKKLYLTNTKLFNLISLHSSEKLLSITIYIIDRVYSFYIKMSVNFFSFSISCNYL